MIPILVLRYLWFLLLTLAVLLLLAGCVSWTYSPSRAARDMTRPRKTPEFPQLLEVRTAELRTRGLEPQMIQVPSSHTRTEENPVVLEGWYIPCPAPRPANPHPDRRCVVLVHGLGVTRLDLIDWMNLFLDAGWDVALFDLRAHGASGGDYVTYGLLESRELADQVRSIRERFQPSQVVVFGYSMGGAIAILALPQLPPDAVGGLIVVGAYSDFAIMSDEYLRARTHGFSTARWRRQVLVEGERLIGGSIDDISPVAALQRLDTPPPPTLLIHGTRDDLVRPHHSEALRKTFNSRAQLLSIPGANHFNVLEIGGGDLQQAVREFLDSTTHHAAADSETLDPDATAGERP